MIKPYRIIVVGRARSGKTFFVKKWLLRLIERYVIYDLDEDGKEFDKNDGEIINSIEDLNKMLKSDGNAWKKYNKNIKALKYPKIIYQPTRTNSKSAKKRLEEFNKICALINEQKDIFFIVDGLSDITLAGDRQKPSLPDEFLLMMTKRKMNQGIGVVITTQRLKECGSELIRPSQLIVMFDMLYPDIKYTEDKLGIKIPKKQVSILPDNYTKYDRNNMITVIDAPPFYCWIYNAIKNKMYIERVYKDGSTLSLGGIYKEGQEERKRGEKNKKKPKLYWKED